MVAPCPCSALINWPDSCIDLVGIQGTEQRPETADQRVQVQRRFGRANGMVSPGLSFLVPPAPSTSAR